MKTCTKCQQEKSLSEFHNDAKLGNKRECKTCRKVMAAEHYAKNSELLKARKRDDYRENPERFKAAAEKWRASNKDKVDSANAVYREENKEKTKAAIQRWRLENKERYRETERAWRLNNPDKVKARADRFSEKNPGRLKESAAVWREANRDKSRKSAQNWAANNPEKRRVNETNRRARKHSAEGKHTVADIKRLFTLQRGKCACCHISIAYSYHVDHTHPLALGGSNDKTNLQLLCPTCNLKKGAKNPVDFMQSIGLLL